MAFVHLRAAPFCLHAHLALLRLLRLLSPPRPSPASYDAIFDRLFDMTALRAAMTPATQRK